MSPLSFAIGAAQFLAVFLWLALLVLAVSGVWTLTCWIAETRQQRRERQAEPDALQELARLDHDLDQYAATIQPLYPTGEQQ
ncbi:hypothetical protein GCM10010331_49750 [Streptomyces xanthochromogenes]|uniref:hypothetical protein n=1 Tax=Streptomyces xanthochromogenes TaxID=67384 RepID=UPI00167C1145|nr:hypothetical protein [Streptomyces xanthochromogenes]GHB55928.1 hypothetical protein GCM10010331_49750 [Streptomyces xanthochromogenes]